MRGVRGRGSERVGVLDLGAERDDVVVIGEVDACDGDTHAEHSRLERQLKVLLDHGEEAARLLGVAVTIREGLFHERVETRSGGTDYWLLLRSVSAGRCGIGSP